MLARRLNLPVVALAFAACVLASSPASAQAPAALTNPTYGFPLPGDHVAATSARSAALALADRWLGESPYENPAGCPAQGLELSPVFQRTSRQDLSSQNRDYDQTFGFPDFAAASFSMPVGAWGFVAYAWQPVLRLEEVAFSAGPLVSPAAVSLSDHQREIRAGLAVSRGFGGARFGVSGEWLRRQDSYETHEISGSPRSGDRVMDFDGSGFGGSAGFTYARDPDRPWGSWIGGAIHYGSELTLDGTITEHLASGDTASTFQLVREAEWSGGISARITVAPATRVVGGVSLRSGADWAGLGRGTTTGGGWSVGLDWKDEELPWGARFGVGQETQPGANEKNSGLLALGFTWVSGDLSLDIGILHRNLAREGFPNSADDRAVGTVRIAF